MRLNWSAPPIYDSANVGITGGNTEFSVMQGGVPIGKAPSGTMANNGAVTFSTALPYVYAGGVWLWYPANAFFAGSAAGIYWTVMSTTTVGVGFNAVYTSGLPAIGVSTPFVSTGPGAFAGDQGTVTLLSFSAPALPINGRFTYDIGFQVNNGAGTKNLSPRIASTNINTHSVTTQNSSQVEGFAQNRGVTGRQVVGIKTLMSVGSGGIPGEIAVDESVSQTITTLVSTPTNATDYIILDTYKFRVLAP